MLRLSQDIDDSPRAALDRLWRPNVSISISGCKQRYLPHGTVMLETNDPALQTTTLSTAFWRRRCRCCRIPGPGMSSTAASALCRQRYWGTYLQEPQVGGTENQSLVRYSLLVTVSRGGAPVRFVQFLWILYVESDQVAPPGGGSPGDEI